MIEYTFSTAAAVGSHLTNSRTFLSAIRLYLQASRPGIAQMNGACQSFAVISASTAERLGGQLQGS